MTRSHELTATHSLTEERSSTANKCEATCPVTAFIGKLAGSTGSPYSILRLRLILQGTTTRRQSAISQKHPRWNLGTLTRWIFVAHNSTSTRTGGGRCQCCIRSRLVLLALLVEGDRRCRDGIRWWFLLEIPQTRLEPPRPISSFRLRRLPGTWASFWTIFSDEREC